MRCWKGSRVADGRWRISVTAPDWGQDHLSLEAVVAYVDGELAPGPHARATQHLGQCPECASQVSVQGQARKALRGAGGPCMPSTLLSSLRSIPQDTDLPSAPPGLAMTADGQLVSMMRPERGQPPAAGGRGFRADVAAPRHHTASVPRPHHVPAPRPAPVPYRGAAQQRPDRPGRLSPMQLRLRVGTGVAVSGLALGALVFGALSTSPAAPATPAPATDRGLPGDAAFGGLNRPPTVLDARLRLGSTGPAPAAPGDER